MTPTIIAALSLVLVAANVVEAAIGFGSTIIALSLGSLLLPLDRLLAIFLPLSMVLSAAIVTRDARLIDGPLLRREILPPVLVGLPLGYWSFAHVNPRTLEIGLGVLIVAVAAFEGTRRQDDPLRPMGRAAGCLWLGLAGWVQGLIASAGPFVVYFAARRIRDKSVFRATLALLWLVLNGLLVVAWAADGHIGFDSLRASAQLLPAIIVGIVAGDYLHRRLPEAQFRRMVLGMFAATGITVAARALLR